MTTVLLIALIVTVIICFAYIAWRESLWQKERQLWHTERKDLYDRLMARDLTEYQEITKPTPPPKAPPSKVVANLKKQNSPRKGGD